jgi:hypothetical protein
MDGAHQPNYVMIACVLAVVYLAVKHYQMTNQLAELGHGYSELGQWCSWLFNQGGYASQVQQQERPRRTAPQGYEGPRGRHEPPVQDRSDRRQERPIQDRDRRSGGGPEDTAMSSDYNFLDDNVFGEFKGKNQPKGGRSRN